ncbi:MAG: glycoside hydrolase family 3 C-terminal domain-containing protein [Bacteroides sp.]|nr:glycoside hydrolase family 3 C-terminal domain-containing protein [Bacteroides sp.]MCM1390955.1 glycoside hydrolase family 3 C-terminal domain-containing protein [Bacteroides sp.]
MKIASLIVGIALAGSLTVSAVNPIIPRDEAMERRIDEMLSKMTLEEKIGQMTQLEVVTLGCDYTEKNPNLKLSGERLDDVIGTHKVGSILNVPKIALSAPQWCEVIEQIQDYSMKTLQIPCIYGLDMNHGASYVLGATLFPQNVNMGATFNRELVRRGGEITAYETRASDVPWTFNPTVDLSRDPRWPRVWENYGEDACLNSELGTAAVLGMQGDDPNRIDRYHIAANLKHFMGYGAPVSGRDRTHSSIGEQEMREKHFAPYLAGIKNGYALSIMVNSTTNNGVPFHANAKYLTTWLKDQLNWDGLIVTDWSDINNLYTREGVAANKKEAIKMAINAGIDMAMEPYKTDYCTLMKELVDEGEIPMSRIDDACARVLRMKMRLGLFETPNTNYADYPLFASKEFADASLNAAEQSMVLLKNEGDILPLCKGTRILLTGPNANSMRALNGGWTYTWQGHLTDRLGAQYNTIYESLCNKFGSENINYEPAVTYLSTGDWQFDSIVGIDRAVAAAADVDVIVACVGENSYCETPGNINDLALSPNQIKLVKELEATGKPVVLILNEGRPRIINEIVDGAKAIVDIMLPSNYGGDALANLLAGDANFSGKLPFTYPKHSASLKTYDYKKGESAKTMSGAYNYNAVVDVQWIFGYGLSYTTFEYSNLRVDKPEFKSGDTLNFEVDVTNTGKMEGMESVLLFSSDLVATTSPDIRRLRQFDKISLKPGETRTVKLSVAADDLAYVGYDEKWILEKGDFIIQVGDKTVEITATETKKWDTPNRE